MSVCVSALLTAAVAQRAAAAKHLAGRAGSGLAASRSHPFRSRLWPILARWRSASACLVIPALSSGGRFSVRRCHDLRTNGAGAAALSPGATLASRYAHGVQRIVELPPDLGGAIFESYPIRPRPRSATLEHAPAALPRPLRGSLRTSALNAAFHTAYGHDIDRDSFSMRS